MIKIQHEGFPLPEKKFHSLLIKIGKRLQLKGTVTIRIAGAAEVRTLNRKYRHKDYATDVLSFPLGEKLPDGFYAGDILICRPLAEKQARQNAQSTEKELLLLMIHGLLHLQGHDHEKDQGEMLVLQKQLFAEYSEDMP
ncbi:MAG: rRNA maturation RNase YbeY [Acidobacteria bacterium]|nr:rRNA maturation RNase YbeY [Acidobacteriota bacterium]MBU4307516.1 rRNA maturation RNase YbeY [Acidobacteriota bacterium]MBU4404555.1 rRNA maturation RNase YbeY [Acidobacteriota bacterium]MCG2810899.1 rRNA maturation RNase YbeY [Candidatus Aminicenantes bacterium]